MRMVGAGARVMAAAVLALSLLAGWQAAAGAQNTGDIAALNSRVTQLHEAGRHAEAIPLAERALTLAERTRDGERRQLATALKNLVALYRARGRIADAEPLARRAVAISEATLGPNHPDVATSLSALADIQRDQGRHADAELLYTRALTIREKALGPDSFLTSETLNNLAALYYQQGRTGEAEALFRRALAIAEKVRGRDSVEVGTSLGNLAQLYYDQRRLAEADALRKRSLAIYEKTLGPNHATVGQTLHSLATLYYVQGRYAEAEPLFRRALMIGENALGRNHPRLVATLNNLGRLSESQGRYAEAEPLYQRALAIAENALGPEHPNVGTVLNSLAHLYQTQGRYARAESLYQRALAIGEKTLGPDHADVGASLSALAELYRVVGRVAEAEPLSRRAVAIAEKVWGPDDSNVSTYLNNLALLYQELGRYIEAEALYKRALAADERALGSEHAHVANTLNNLGALYRDEGRADEAEALYRRALAIRERALGQDHPDLAYTLANLAALYGGRGRTREAEALHKRALAIRERVFGDDNPELAMSLHNLAAFYQDLGRTADAEALYKRTLSIAAKTLGREHRLVAVGLNNLAQVYKSRDRYAEAEPLLKAAIGIWEKTLGPDHPDVSLSLSNLAGLYLSVRDWAQAAEFWQKSTEIIIRRSGRGAQTRQSELASLGTSDASQQRSQFLGLIKAYYRLAEADPAQATSIAARMFETAQWAGSSKAAQSLAQMAARQAKGSGALARLVRERQDLVGEWQAKDKLLIAAVSQAPAMRVALAERELRDRLSLIDARVSDIEATLAREFPDYAALASPKPLTIAQVQALLSKDEVLVLFLDTSSTVSTPEETFVWAVTQTGFRWLLVGIGTPSLEREVKALRCGLDFSSWKQPMCSGLLKVAYSLQDYLAGRPLPFDAGRSHALYRELLGSIEDLIRNKRLLVATSGPLTALPLQVLVTERPATAVPAEFAGYARISWLGQRHAVTALPSVASLKALRDHAKPTTAAAGAFVGFGNPLLMGLDGNDRRAWDKQSCPPPGIIARAQETFANLTEPWAKLFRNGLANLEELRLQPPLPETADELCAVARMAGVDPDRAVHLGAHASERRIKALSADGTLANARIIHFATHGLLAEETESFNSGQAEPALLLTPPTVASEDDDGLLTASEVANLKLNADWVILSACNTAAGGDKVGGEALSGLARAFFYAGARSLLVSHWYVDSGSTVTLITTAFRERKSAPAIGWAEVMRRAMASLIAAGGRNAHPAHWAPFAVVGDGGSR